MDNRAEVRELLISRRATITPEQAGLTLTLYTAEPTSPSGYALDLLASWTATRAETSVAPS